MYLTLGLRTLVGSIEATRAPTGGLTACAGAKSTWSVNHCLSGITTRYPVELEIWTGSFLGCILQHQQHLKALIATSGIVNRIFFFSFCLDQFLAFPPLPSPHSFFLYPAARMNTISLSGPRNSRRDSVVMPSRLAPWSRRFVPRSTIRTRKRGPQPIGK